PSPRFSVRGVLTAKTTIFLKFEPIRSTTLIFRSCVVTTLAFITRQNHHLPHSISLSSIATLLDHAHTAPPRVGLRHTRGYHTLRQDITDDAGAHRAPPLANRKAQLFLQRNRRDEFHLHRHIVPR